ncbi:hypothetical protein IFR05_003978 [Cadophora sp. M221]|nr:hypothetical protein IFR05_003978 [Cadophora sp. M221]
MASQTHLDDILDSNTLICERAKSIIFRRRGNLCLSFRISPPVCWTCGSLGLEDPRVTSGPDDIQSDSMEVSNMDPRVAYLQLRIQDCVDKPFEPCPPPVSNIEALVRILVHGKLRNHSGSLVGGDESLAGINKSPESDPKPEPQPTDPGYGSKSLHRIGSKIPWVGLFVLDFPSPGNFAGVRNTLKGL